MIKHLTKPSELRLFKKSYEKLSGLNVPIEYLEKGEAYGFKVSGKILGGYIISSGENLRTIEVFTKKENQILANSLLGKSPDYCEVCCFWMSTTYRKKIWFNSILWMKMAYDVSKRKELKVLFGTSSKGLAKVYGYPKNSHLIINDKINGVETFIFSALIEDFFSGVWSIIKLRIFGGNSFGKLPIAQNILFQKNGTLEVN